MKTEIEIRTELSKIPIMPLIGQDEAFRCSTYMMHCMLWVLGQTSTSPSQIVLNQLEGSHENTTGN